MKMFPGMTETGQKVLGVILFASALTFYTVAVLSIELEKTPFFDLPPAPDAIEYFAGAKALAEEGVYRIHVAGQLFPPRYPFGYSLLMVPCFRLGLEPIEVPFRVSQVLGIALLASFFAYLWWRRHYVEAGLTTLILVTFPAFLIQARSPMSEMSATFFLAVGMIGIHSYTCHGRTSRGAFGTFSLMLAIWCRIALLPLLLVPIYALIARQSEQSGRKWIDAAAFFLVMLAGVTPLLVWNYLSFGDPLQTGYHFWLGERAQVESSFSIEYLPTNLLNLAKELVQQENPATTAGHYGEGSYFGPEFFVLLLLTGFTLRRSPVFRVFALPAGLYFVLMMFYFAPLVRLLSPLLVLSIPAVSFAWCSCLRAAQTLKTKGLLLVLLVCQLAMFPGTRLDPDLDRYLRVSRLYRPAEDYLLVSRFNRLRDNGPALILTDLSPPYVYALTNGLRNVFPLTGKHDYQWGQVDFGQPERVLPPEIQRALANGVMIYSLVGRVPFETIEQTCPVPEGSSWKVLYSDEAGRTIGELVADS